MGAAASLFFLCPLTPTPASFLPRLGVIPSHSGHKSLHMIHILSHSVPGGELNPTGGWTP